MALEVFFTEVYDGKIVVVFNVGRPETCHKIIKFIKAKLWSRFTVHCSNKTKAY